MTPSTAEDRSSRVVGVVGAGTMGAGIAQLAIEAGDEVLLHDVDEAAYARAEDRIRDGLARRGLKLDLDPDTVDDWVDGRLERLRAATTLAQVGEEADIVVEAALENLDLKRTVFSTLDAAARPEAILATNTSALSIRAIASAVTRPERVIGLHFFNPAPLMPLVEVVVARATDPTIADVATRYARRWGKTPVRCADTPGFIVNRVNRPYTIQALRLLEAGVASVEAIDNALRDAGFPMGPFELIDLVGVDVNLAAAAAIWEGLGRPERLRPSPIQERLVADGELGRKSGAGFYEYEGSRRLGARRLPGLPIPDEPYASPEDIRDRILLAIVDEAYRALGEKVSTAEDIDLALRLGAAHPIGPFERTKQLGGPRAVLERLAEVVRELGGGLEPAPLLVRTASDR